MKTGTGISGQGESVVRPALSISSPSDGAASNRETIDVEVEVRLDERRITRSQLDPLLAGDEIGILVDGVVRAMAEPSSGPKATFKAKLRLQDLPEGHRSLQAVIRDASDRENRILDSDPIRLTVDRTPPRILSVTPSHGSTVERRNFGRVLVRYQEPLSGLDCAECSAFIDDVALSKPKESPTGLAFKIVKKPAQGSHGLKVVLTDRSANAAVFQTDFRVTLARPADKRKQAAEAETKHAALLDRLAHDKKFGARILSDPEDALAEVGVPISNAMRRTLPPKLRPRLAGKLARTDRAQTKKKLSTLQEKVKDKLKSRDNERIARATKRLGNEGLAHEDGTLTRGGKSTLAAALEDPAGMVESLGVKMTKEERSALWPRFNKVEAEAMAEWISDVHSRRAEKRVKNRKKKAVFQEAARKAQADPEEQLAWLTRPAEKMREVYPEATASELAALPRPISKAKARARLETVDLTAPRSPLRMPHNSSDLVIGVSFPQLNETLGFVLGDVLAGTFPVQRTEPLSTGLPEPLDRVELQFTLQAPGDLRPVDAELDHLAATAAAVISAATATGPLAVFEATVTPVYSLAVLSKMVHLVVDHVEVLVVEKGTDGTGTPLDENVGPVLEVAIGRLLQEAYPDRAIPLLDLSGLAMSLPAADYAVDLESIEVHNDEDPVGSGELFFEIKVGRHQPALYGQFDADSGTVIPLNRRFRLKQGREGFTVSIAGLDEDWPDGSDYLGSAAMVHRPDDISVRCSYCVTGQTMEQVPIIESVVSFACGTVCWVVELIASIFNWCGELLGYESRWETQCRSECAWIARAVQKLISYTVTNYTLRYSIRPLSGVEARFDLGTIDVTPQGIFVPFDATVPEIPNRGFKTVARDFLGAAGFGVAVSENLLDKAVRSMWRYAAVPRHFSTTLAERSWYISVDPAEPGLWLEAGKVCLDLPLINGSAGVFVGPLPIPLAVPTGATITGELIVADRQLALRMTAARFRGDSLATLILNFISKLYFCLSLGPAPGYTVLLDELNTFSVSGFDFAVEPAANIAVTEAEMIQTFNVDNREAAQEKAADESYDAPHGDSSTLMLVGNSNPRSMELHRLDCTFAERMHPQNIFMIHGSAAEVSDLYDRGLLAGRIIDQYTSQGYDGCYYCLRRHHWK